MDRRIALFSAMVFAGVLVAGVTFTSRSAQDLASDLNPVQLIARPVEALAGSNSSSAADPSGAAGSAQAEPAGSRGDDDDDRSEHAERPRLSRDSQAGRSGKHERD